MKKKPNATITGRRGQSLVELAISLTVVLLLLSGAVTFGMAFFSYVAMRDAAQEGALFASFNPCANPDPSGICALDDTVNIAGVRERVRASSTTPINFSDAAVVPDGYITATLIGPPCEGNVSGVPNAVTVMVEYDFPIFMPFVGAIIGSQEIHLRAPVTDTILEPRCPPSP